MNSKNIPILSLFSGAGGMDVGFRKSGMRPVLALDNDEAAVLTYNFNAKQTIAKQMDLARLKPEVLDEMLNGKAAPRGVVGGPPCQGFSVGNAYSDPKDPRNQLPYRYIDILKKLNAANTIDFFVFENVPGLKAPRHLPRFRRIHKKMESAGFQIHETSIDAYEFGVPQHRKRLFVVGINSGIARADEFSFPQPSGPPLTVRDAIGHLPEPVFRSNGMTPKDIPYHPNHWTMEPRSKRFEEKSFNNGRSFRKLDWDEPSWTVAYGNREIHVHPNGHRRLSVLEALLLQGFPETYVLRGNFCQQVDQVSNAVPPPVASEIAKSIYAKLYGRKKRDAA